MKAVYAGSFDPPTIGHMDIIERSAKLFDTLHIVVAVNGSKRGMLSSDARVSLLKALVEELGLENILVEPWDGLLASYAQDHGCSVLVRGIRSAQDMSYERVMASMNRLLPGNLETFFLLSRPEYIDIHASAVRELVGLGRLPKGLVPASVEKALEMAHGPLLQD